MNDRLRATFSLVGLPRFFLLSLLLVCVPLPFLLALQYLGGGIRSCAAMLVSWLSLVVVYWWPVGTLLFLWKRGWVSRLFIGYLISLPLYFLSLYLVYPAFGGHFHPSSPAVWGIYSSQSPFYFLLATTLFLLTRGGATFRQVTTWLVAIAFAAGVVAPVAYAIRVDRYIWPRTRSSRVNIVNARLVDPFANRIVNGVNVHVEDGRIVELVDAVADSTQWPAIDAGGKFLLPGLIDVHTHLQAPVQSVLGPFNLQFLLESFFANYAPQRRVYLENGVTTVRDVGGPAAHAYQMRTALLSRQLLGPELFVVGRLVTSPHGHPVSTIWNAETSRQGAILASDSSTLISGLEKNYEAGPPDAVKFIYGTIGQAKEKLAPSLLEEGIAWASSKRLISIVHAETTDEVAEAARSGATGIEHVASIENLPDDLVSLLVQKRTFVDPTFGELNAALTLRHVDDARRKEILQQKCQFIRRLQQAGVKLAIGTDAPLVPYGTGLHDEFDDFIKCGFSPAQILVFDTFNNAAYLGQGATLGQIAQGFRADLILVPDNPLQNIETLRKPTWVMLGGQIVVPPPREQ
ncbi:MAG: amidohydrolase family protein [Candidatus Sulfotelmatobacter sp.]